MTRSLRGRDGRVYDGDELQARLAARAADLAPELLPGGHRSGSNYFASDVGGGPGNSLALKLHGPYAGTWKDFNGNSTGDLLDLVQIRYGLGFAAAVEHAAQLVGLAPDRRAGGTPVPAPNPRAVEADRRRRLARRLDAIAEQAAHWRTRRKTQRWLWGRRQEIKPGSPASRYLEDTRAISCAGLPPTIGWLPASGDHPPSVILAFGWPAEPEPGRLAIEDRQVRGVQLLQLRAAADGAVTKAGQRIVGHCPCWPIVLRPFNDGGLDLHIVEGAEDGLSLSEVVNAGVWACGGAGRMAMVARVVPRFVGTITLWLDDDDAGAIAVTAARAVLLARGFADWRIQILQLGSTEHPRA